MDADDSQDEHCHLRTSKSVWSWPSDAEVKFCETFRKATGAVQPGTPAAPRGEHAISRKTIAQGMPVAYLW
jgi:hypothetical protein